MVRQLKCSGVITCSGPTRRVKAVCCSGVIARSRYQEAVREPRRLDLPKRRFRQLRRVEVQKLGTEPTKRTDRDLADPCSWQHLSRRRKG